ncbi:MAG: AMP-binding protein [Gammaproteobacteria bacterium]|nr:AMP-binding protein [Gammaproteobacteria bacterium]
MTDAGGRLITERLFDIAERDTDRELVIDPVFGRFSYGDVAEQVERLAFGLRELGFGPGDVVILQLPNWSPFLIFHLALTAIGAVTGNIPFVYRAREVGSILRLTGARGLVVPSQFRGYDFRAMGQSLHAEFSGLSHVFLVGGQASDEGDGVISYEALMRRSAESRGHRRDLAALTPAPDDMTAFGFTSGTTGDLKGAVFDTNVLNAVNKGLVDRYGLGEDDRIFGCSPLGHAVGFTHALRMTLTIGGSIVLLEHWEPGSALAAIHRERCTFMAAATPFLMDMVYHPALAQHDNLPSLRLFLCGGTSVPERVMKDARKNLPHTFTSPLWGMTECGGVTCCPFDAPPEKIFKTDGLPCGSMELKIVDPDMNRVPPGIDGELMVRGPMVARGYFRQPELTVEYFQADGFFRTGDQARMDDDGYIKITGRIKDLIIRGGVNISPVEIENVLFSHPKIANVAVVGAPDPRLGERACAFVVLKEETSFGLEEVQRWMEKSGVAKPKWPERVEVVKSLPATASGKIQKFRLREIVAEKPAGASDDGLPAGDPASG